MIMHNICYQKLANFESFYPVCNPAPGQANNAFVCWRNHQSSQLLCIPTLDVSCSWNHAQGQRTYNDIFASLSWKEGKFANWLGPSAGSPSVWSWCHLLPDGRKGRIVLSCSCPHSEPYHGGVYKLHPRISRKRGRPPAWSIYRRISQSLHSRRRWIAVAAPVAKRVANIVNSRKAIKLCCYLRAVRS